MLRDGTPVCTTCGAVVGGAGADQIRHSTWHVNLAGLFALAGLIEPAENQPRNQLPDRRGASAGVNVTTPVPLQVGHAEAS